MAAHIRTTSPGGLPVSSETRSRSASWPSSAVWVFGRRLAFRFPRKSRQCGSATPNGQGQATITLAERERAIGITLVIPFLSSLISSIGLRVAWAKSLFCNDWPAFSARFRPPFAPLSAWFRRCNSLETISKSARTFEISPSTAVNLPSETSLSRIAFHLRIETPQTPESQRASSGIGPPRS